MKNEFRYTNSNKRYYTLDYFYKQKFGKKVYKISLNAGFTCPNKDGTKGYGGCIYCSKLGSGDFAGNQEKDLITQFQEVKNMMRKKWKDGFYIGYFQANTNTYAKVEVLKQKYEPILALENVIGLNISTRPDAITEECLDYLADLNKRTYLTIELGLQTIHEKISKFINRGHDLKCFEEMVKKLRKRKIDVVVHIMNGLPYETKEMMLETVKYLNQLDIQGIKIHMLHILKNTALADIYQKKPFHVLTKEEYIDIVCDQIELFREDIVVHRITGDPKKEDLIEPLWLLKKFSVLDDIDKELEGRGTYQGFQKSILNRVKERINRYVKRNDLVIDATIGNGKDTVALAKMVPEGKVFGFDIQKSAIQKAKVELEKEQLTNFELFQTGHEYMTEILKDYQNKISFIVFNLGYLPGGDKTITTTVETTKKALEEAEKLLNNKGKILITVYPGHEEGKRESVFLKDYLKEKNFIEFHNTENEIAPYLIQINKQTKRE